jgi:5'-nucleotidase / UDP-sugar diphosphatase
MQPGFNFIRNVSLPKQVKMGTGKSSWRKLCIALGVTALTAGAAAVPKYAGQTVVREGNKGEMSQPRPITILHTNDIHGHLESWRGWDGELMGQTVGGLARLSAHIREARSSTTARSVLLLDAGDTIGDTMIAAETEGRAVIETMNAIGYDAMVVGNHEPDFTAEKLRERIAEARFPVLAANITNRSNGELFTKPYIIRDVNGVRVGILGIAYPNTPLTSARKNIENLRFRAAVETAREHVPRLRREGAEIVIALTHLGLSADKQLAEKVEGIDVIVGGHSHNRMKEALQVRQTLIVQAAAHGSDLGRLDLTIENGRIVSHRRTLIPITGAESDRASAELLSRQRAPYEQKMSTPVGRALTLIARAQTIAGQEPERRDAESPADDLFADAIRETTKADIAFLPGLGYGVAIQPGEITAAGLRNLIPHDSAVWTMRLTGAQIRRMLEQAIENFTTKDMTKKVGGMIQVSGLRFSYDPAARPNQRVREVTVGGRAIAPRRRYTVAVNALLAEGGHNYRSFERGTDRREVGKQYEMVRDWIERRGEVSAPPTDRIIKVANQ